MSADGSRGILYFFTHVSVAVISGYISYQIAHEKTTQSESQFRLVESQIVQLKQERESLKQGKELLEGKLADAEKNFNDLKEKSEKLGKKVLNLLDENHVSLGLYGVRANNTCGHPIKIAVQYKNILGEWETEGWYSLKEGESSVLNKIYSKNSTFSYYAETTDGSNLRWGAEYNQGSTGELDGQSLQLRVQSLEEPSSLIDPYELTITCV